MSSYTFGQSGLVMAHLLLHYDTETDSTWRNGQRLDLFESVANCPVSAAVIKSWVCSALYIN